ncbi:hypothetical protein [Streptomyces aureus]|nr:hypothetical protein [Streptomyces aureus]
MTAVLVEITPKPAPDAPADPAGIVLVSDVAELTASVESGCNDDNPYK